MADSPAPKGPPPLPSSGPPPLPAASELEQAIIALKSGPWDPQKLIRGLFFSDAYLLLEIPSDENYALLLVSDEIPHFAFFTSPARFAAAQEHHPDFVHPHKVKPWDFIKTLNDGVGFIINPYSPDCEYYSGPGHTAKIRDLATGEPSGPGTQHA
jgi:hypothetical protein